MNSANSRRADRRVIGVLGGLAPASTISYYEMIMEEYRRLLDDEWYPETVIYSLPFAEIVQSSYSDEARVLEALRSLAAAGADFVVAACNSIHRVFDSVAPVAPIPWINIVEPVNAYLQDANILKVGLLGTRVTMEGRFYQTPLDAAGVEVMTPSAADRATLDRVIFQYLVRKEVPKEAVSIGVRICESLMNAGCEMFVAACTELPYLFQKLPNEIAWCDPGRLHVRYAVQLAIGAPSGDQVPAAEIGNA